MSTEIAPPTGQPAALTPTGRVILGMIAFGRQTGYDIKQFVDKSTRHFWAASYRQIYPQPRPLEEQGMVQGGRDPLGGRARTVYQLTDGGRHALHEWLISHNELLYELRDEGMLKLFFSDLGPEVRIENVRAMRANYQRKLDQLSQLEERAAGMRTGPQLTLEIGLGITRWLIEWCDATAKRLEAHERKGA